VERAWWDGNQIVALLNKSLPGNHHPPGQPTLMAPRLIELCFQAAGLWEMGVQGRMGLPLHLDQVSVTLPPELSESRLYAIITPLAAQGSFDAEVLDTSGNRYVRLLGYRTVAFPNALELAPLKALQAAMALEAAVA